MAAWRGGLLSKAVLADRVCRQACLAGGGWLLLYTVLTWLARDSASLSRLVGDILYQVPIAASAVAAWYAARRLTGRHRGLWLILAVAYTAQLCGEAVWAGYDYLTTDGPPQPSLADAGYLTSSALTVVAVLVGFGGAGRLRHVRGLLDTVLIAVSVGALGWQMLIAPQLSGKVTASDVVNVAYPLLDVAMVGCLSIIGIGGHRAVPLAVRLVGLAGGLNAVNDMIYTYLVIFSDYDTGGWLDVCFETAAVIGFLAAVVAARRPEPPAERRSFDRGLTLLPILTSTVATFTLVVLEKVRTGSVGTLTLVIVGVLFITVLLRQYLFTADRAALAEQLRQAVTEQRRLAVTDGLTGLYNRRYLTDRMAETTGTVSLLVIDLDYFKRINDTYGHPVGDSVLKETAARIAAAARDTDVVARYGGEEFVVLLPGTNEDEAALIATRIRDSIRAAPVIQLGLEIPVTASVGVATEHAEDTDRLMDAADRAVYDAKSQGRDRVSVAREPSPTPVRTAVLDAFPH
jgi:diguanylate cyclase (GGDEF)-like protein